MDATSVPDPFSRCRTRAIVDARWATLKWGYSAVPPPTTTPFTPWLITKSTTLSRVCRSADPCSSVGVISAANAPDRRLLSFLRTRVQHANLSHYGVPVNESTTTFQLQNSGRLTV